MKLKKRKCERKRKEILEEMDKESKIQQNKDKEDNKKWNEIKYLRKEKMKGKT